MSFDWIAEQLDELGRTGLRRTRRTSGSVQGPRIYSGERELVNFSSNDYLALAGDPRLARATAHAARRYGCGAGASPLVSGYLPPHRRLEKALAGFEGEEAAVVFASGYAANLGVITALVGEEDAVFSDRLNHASIIDGCRLSRARVHVYQHADVEHLEELLVRHGPLAGRRLIVTDSVFSMDGDFAPLERLHSLARRYDAMFLVDEAHATGVLGPGGRGLTAGLDGPSERPAGRCLVKLGTLSKALGAQGGFVCGPKSVKDWLVNRARSYIFSTALAPAACAAARRALAILDGEPERREHLVRLAARLRTALRSEGFSIGGSESHIIPVILGEPWRAVEASARLRERNLLVPAIRPPSVPEGTSRLRISLTAGHREEDVDELVRALLACRGRVPGVKL